MSLEERMKQEFMAGLEEGFAGVPMDYPEGIRPLGVFHIDGGVEPAVGEIQGTPGEISPNLDDEVIDAEIIE